MKNKNIRSRRGCVDCRKARIKCDEVHPECGTCHRRGYICRGYVQTDRSDLKSQSLSITAPVLSHAITRPLYDASRFSNSTVVTETTTFSQCDAESPSTAYSGDVLAEWNSTANNTLVPRSKSVDESEGLNQPPLYLISLSSIPQGIISNYDWKIIELYFNRHPAALVISPEFVEEMKSNMFQVFHSDPQTVCDSLSAIGHNYLGDKSTTTLVPVLNRKGRILARLRAMDGVGHDLEKTIVLLICLCTLEVSFSFSITLTCRTSH